MQGGLVGSQAIVVPLPANLTPGTRFVGAETTCSTASAFPPLCPICAILKTLEHASAVVRLLRWEAAVLVGDEAPQTADSFVCG